MEEEPCTDHPEDDNEVDFESDSNDEDATNDDVKSNVTSRESHEKMDEDVTES